MYCIHCGAELAVGAGFCPACGAEAGAVTAALSEAQSIPPPPPPGCAAPLQGPPGRTGVPGPSPGSPGQPVNSLPGQLSWSIRVPIFRNRIILKQLGLGIGIPIGIIVIVIGLTSGKSVYTLYALGLIGALLFFTWLFIMVVYGGKHDAAFHLDDKGALFRTQPKEAKKNRIVNTLAVLLGLLSGKPAVAGAGMLAQSRQQVFIRWKRATRVKYVPRARTILLRAGWTENVGIFCTPENYAVVEQFVRAKTKHLEGEGK